jgi:hypothetical protein
VLGIAINPLNEELGELNVTRTGEVGGSQILAFPTLVMSIFESAVQASDTVP